MMFGPPLAYQGFLQPLPTTSTSQYAPALAYSLPPPAIPFCYPPWAMMPPPLEPMAAVQLTPPYEQHEVTVHKQRRVWTSTDYGRIIEANKAGEDVRAIAAKMGMPMATVSRGRRCALFLLISAPRGFCGVMFCCTSP